MNPQDTAFWSIFTPEETKRMTKEKMALHAQAELLQNEKRSCKITTLALGYVDTEFNKDYNGAKLSYDNIIDNVKWIVDNEAEIKFMILSARNNNE